MFETLFGSEMPLAARFFIAFLVVLALIGATAWLVRRFGASRLGANTRGRQPRLAVIDAASVDGRRRLVLIRRDNVEHLLMIGGPTDVVVEPNIVRVVGAREVTREPVRVTMPGDTLSRPVPLTEGSWPLQPTSEPSPVTAQRPYRTSVPDEPWLTPEPVARPSRPAADSLTGLAAELSARLNPPNMAAAPAARAEPLRVNAPAPAEPAASPQTDHNLAEMAQQLEAALRRGPVAEGRPPVTDPLAGPAAAMPAPRAPEPMRPAIREPKVRIDPRIEPRIEPKLDPMPTPGKNLYDNLEQEMASLLGRPSGKT
jgi:flagellar protein FliO/FliZ